MKCSSSKLLLPLLAVMLTLFYCHSLSAQNWTQVQGIVAQDIGAGKTGAVWATGTNGAIYRWNGSSWQTMPGGAARISVGPDGNAWVVNSGGQIFQYNSSANNWTLKPGAAKDIGVGADGSVWVIGTGTVAGGFEIFKWNGSGWNKIPGGAVRIAVDPSGNAWVVNNTNNVFAYNGTSFVQKPGSVKDIGIGANGDIWCTGADGKVYKWNSSNWQVQSGGASSVSVAPDGNAWVVNSSGQVFKTTNAGTVQVKTIFTRGQTFEYRMLQALKISPYTNNIFPGGVVPQFGTIDPLGQAFGRLGLLAAEVHAQSKNFTNATAESLLSDISNFPQRRQEVSGILAYLVMNEVQKTGTDAQTTALKTWATSLFKSVKIRAAKAVLDEYDRWEADWCAYEGISEEECRVKSQGISSLFSARKPPQDLIGKNGLKAMLTNNADAVAVGVSLGVAAATTAIAFGGLTSVMTFGATAASTVSLFNAFGAGGISVLGAGFAGVVAAPVAAAVLCIVVGVVEGYAVVEAVKLKPMLKMKLGAAMTDPVNIVNVMADSSSRDMFFIGFQEAAAKNFQVTQPNVNGEVRFYCQAGYVSQFRLSYTLNGQTQTFTTPELPVGHEKSYPIPHNATNIRVQGWYALAGWKDLFNQTLAQPTYICYTSYGTVFEPKYKTDCPEVGSMTTNANELTVTQGGGYIARIRLTYTNNGSTVTAIDQNNIGAGWRNVYKIPATATNIKLQAWSSTGLVWEPWKAIIDKTWPTPPNECIKVYGTTLDPKWNNECN